MKISKDKLEEKICIAKENMERNIDFKLAYGFPFKYREIDGEIYIKGDSIVRHFLKVKMFKAARELSERTKTFEEKEDE